MSDELRAWVPIERVYPDAIGRDGRFWGAYDYSPLIRSFGYDVVLQVDEYDYQGSSWVLFKDGDRYGYLEFGWGSCSGCDALQACESYAEIDQLRKELHESIKWGSATELLGFFREHDWEGDWSWHALECREFVEKATRILEEAALRASGGVTDVR